MSRYRGDPLVLRSKTPPRRFLPEVRCGACRAMVTFEPGRIVVCDGCGARYDVPKDAASPFVGR